MTRAVRLGVAATTAAIEASTAWEDVAPERRGIFIAASPQVGGQDALGAALDAACASGEFFST